MVQVKSMWEDKNSFDVPLLSLERLAKLTEPSFIFVARFGDDLRLRDAYLLHMAGQNLKRILKRLTLESSKGRPISNDQTVRFALSDDWRRLLPSDNLSAVLHEIIENYAPEGGYQTTKRKELSEAGYGPMPITIKLTLEGVSEDDLDDGFLGLKPIPVLNLTSTEERFGIKRPFPMQLNGPGTLRVTPQGGAQGRIFFRRGRLGLPIVRNCTLIPSLVRASLKDFRFLAQAPPFRLDINSASKFTLTVEDLSSQRHPIAWWRQVFKVLELMGRDDFCFELYGPQQKKLFGANVVTAPLEPQVADAYGRAGKTFEMLAEIVEAAGVESIEFAFEEAWSARAKIEAISAMIKGDRTKFSGRLESSSEIIGSLVDEEKLGVVCDLIEIGPTNFLLGLITIVTTKKDLEGYVLQGVAIQPGVVAAGQSMSIDDFAKSLAEESGAEFQIVGGLGSAIGTKPDEG